MCGEGGSEGRRGRGRRDPLPRTELTPCTSLPPAAVKALRSSSVYSYWVAAYALNCGAFERDFSQAMQRLHQLGAGQTWHPDTSYQWRGLQGSWEGFGPSIQPQVGLHSVGDS